MFWNTLLYFSNMAFWKKGHWEIRKIIKQRWLVCEKKTKHLGQSSTQKSSRKMVLYGHLTALWIDLRDDSCSVEALLALLLRPGSLASSTSIWAAGPAVSLSSWAAVACAMGAANAGDACDDGWDCVCCGCMSDAACMLLLLAARRRLRRK